MATRQRLRRQRNQPYRPLAPSFETEGDFNRAVRERTQAQWRPQAAQLRRAKRQERRLHKGRQQQIRNDFGWYADQLGQNAQSMRNFSQDMLGGFQTNQLAAQRAMLDAITDMQGADTARANLMGATNAPQMANQAAAAATAGNEVSGIGAMLSGVTGALGSAAQDRVADARLGQTRAQLAARDAAQSNLQDLRSEHRELLATIPQIREAMRKNVMDEEIAKQSERARQRIAAESVDLEWARLTEDARQADMASSLGWAQLAEDSRMNTAAIKQNRRDLQAQIIGATGEAEKEAAKLQAKRYESMLKAGMEFLKASDYKERPNLVNPSGMFQMLTRMGTNAQALDIMQAAGGPVGKWAKNRINIAGLRREIRSGAWRTKPPPGPRGPSAGRRRIRR